MGRSTEAEQAPRWRMMALGVGAVALAGFLWWSQARGVATRVDANVVCVKCQHEGTVKVGETPAGEEWPRACPGCQQKTLYMAVRCPVCRKTVALKHPDGERFGYPAQCPHCRDAGVRGT